MAYLREMNVISVLFRLFLSVLLGGLIGLERARKRRPAGFRTYLFVCLGASLAMMLGQYNHYMLETRWVAISETLGVSTDISRLGAQVINGVGFLGAGTILVTGRQEIKGVTTASGLWASACMGLAVGVGFYECVFVAFCLIFISMRVLPYIEYYIVVNTRNMIVYIDFKSLDDLSEILAHVKKQDVHIYEVDIHHEHKEIERHHSAVFTIRLNWKTSHLQVLSAISELETVLFVEEL